MTTATFTAALLCALLALAPAAASPAAAAADIDHLILALSWSPSWCASAAGQTSDSSDETQCQPGARHGFIVHGLWPEFSGGEAADCSAPLYVPRALADDMADLMPSPGLVFHEWRKHGTCSGLTQRGYFSLIRKLYEGLVIPPAYRAPERPVTLTPSRVIADFTAANPGLRPGMMMLTCGRGSGRAWLQELRICYTPDGSGFTPCGDAAPGCAARELVIPPVR